MTEDRRREGRRRCQMNQDQCTKGARGVWGGEQMSRAGRSARGGAQGERRSRREAAVASVAARIQYSTAFPKSRSELSLDVETVRPWSWLFSMNA